MVDISVMIPCYNAEKFIETTLLSVINQSVKPFEIVVVDDASTDKSMKVVEKFFTRYDVGVLVCNEENLGVGGTRQRCVENAIGDHIAFLSSDDKYDPKFLEKCLPFLDGESATFTDYWRWNYAENIMHQFNAPHFTYPVEFQDLVVEWALGKNMFVNFSSVIIPKWWFSRVKFLEMLRHGEDLIFLLETVILDLKWRHVAEPLLLYRIHPSQGTSLIRRDRPQFEQLWSYVKPRLKRLGVKKTVIEDAYTRSVKNRFPKLHMRGLRKLRRWIRSELI